MRKLFLYPMFLAGALCVACDPVENTYHNTTIYHPGNGMSVLYADQTKDSLSLISFDSYSITVHGDWIHLKDQDLSYNVPSGSYVEGSIYIDVDPNTTGKQRDAYLTLTAYGNELTAYYRQVPYMNISRPAMNQDGEYRREVKFDSEKDSVEFRAYGNWTLAFDGEKPDWIDWQEEAVTSGDPGSRKVVYTLKKNETLDSRTAKLVLTSNGVTSDITVVQQNQRD